MSGTERRSLGEAVVVRVDGGFVGRRLAMLVAHHTDVTDLEVTFREPNVADARADVRPGGRVPVRIPVTAEVHLCLADGRLHADIARVALGGVRLPLPLVRTRLDALQIEVRRQLDDIDRQLRSHGLSVSSVAVEGSYLVLRLTE